MFLIVITTLLAVALAEGVFISASAFLLTFVLYNVFFVVFLPIF